MLRRFHPIGWINQQLIRTILNRIMTSSRDNSRDSSVDSSTSSLRDPKEIRRPLEETQEGEILNKYHNLQIPAEYEISDGEIITLDEVLTSRRRQGILTSKDQSKLPRYEIGKDGLPTVYFPRNLMREDCFIGVAFSSMIRNSDLKIKKYYLEREVEIIESEEMDNFFIGLGFGMTDERPTRLDRSKSGIERGRAVAYALRVHGEYQRADHPIGLKGLKKDNFFFGNNIKEVNAQKQPVKYALKSAVSRFFKDIKVGEAIFDIFSKFAHKIGLDNHTEQNYNHAMELYTESFDKYIARFSRTTVTQIKGRTVVKLLRRPGKPTRSPLFTKGESGVLQQLLTPLWENMDLFQKEWIQYLKQWGFASVDERISSVMDTRYKALEAFARATTNRLNTIRKDSTEKDKKRKADVTRNEVEGLLRKRENLIAISASEISSIIPSNMLVYCVNEGLNKESTKVRNGQEALSVIKSALYVAYEQEKIIEKLDKPKDLENPLSDEDFARTFNVTSDVLSRIGALKDYIRSLANFRKHTTAQVKNLAMVTNIMQNIKKSITSIDALDETVKTFAWRQMSLRYPKTKLGGLSSVLALENSISTLLESAERFWIKNDNEERTKLLSLVSSFLDSI